jgi:Flp pilus assembly protein TadG
MRIHRARRGAHRERGASAVEFAIVLPVLVVMVFGILDYGLFFFDSVGMRQGAREAARQAVVLRVDTANCGGTVSFANIACTARNASDNVLGRPGGAVTGGGPPQVKVYMKLLQNGSNGPGWQQGNQFVMCTQVGEKSATGLVPFPASGLITTKVAMSIESAASAPSGALVTDTPPSGGSWSWC